MLRTVLADEPGQGMQSAQTLVACAEAALALLLKVGEKRSDQVGREIHDLQAVDGLLRLLRGKGQVLRPAPI